MGYRNIQECVQDLERHGDLVRVAEEVDPYLEVGAIQRRVYQAGGPALLFARVKGCSFPMLGNLFGTLERTRFLFRDTLPHIEKLVRLKLNPAEVLKEPLAYAGLPFALKNLVPKKVRKGPIFDAETTVEELPQLVSWPRDGGAFITLPQVYSESVASPGWRSSNIGMYRVQISGGSYVPNREVGLHYQIHRGLGVHHAEAIERGIPLRVNVFVGGPPALTVAAVMPLPEGMPEISFAGLLAGHRIPVIAGQGKPAIVAEADFCITGTIDPGKSLPEGPFGDHLGYYSLAHDFPVLRVEKVFHRKRAIWPFTTVGRPPQEDTSFGAFIHELTGPLIPSVIPGVKAVHAVDAAGVHPLLLAIGSERYTPYEKERQPRELLTIANSLLGQGQLSLAKYLFIAAQEDDQALDIHDIPGFLRHVLERVDWRRDLHFQTSTTIDTLDYSGTGLNQGSKVVIAAAGPRRRTLPTEIPSELRLPDGFSEPRLAMAGVLVVKGPKCSDYKECMTIDMGALCSFLSEQGSVLSLSLIVVVDDAEFAAKRMDNFLWVTFTRSNPAADIYGVKASMHCKHWGCSGPLVIDARIKPHHAPVLEDDPVLERRVDALGAPGRVLHGII